MTSALPAAKAYKRAYVEISNVCNLKCSFCPEVHREARVMAPALFRQVVAQVAPLAVEVCLHLMGEPLGHPQLAELLDICAEHALPVNVTTNGLLLNAARAALLLQPIVRQVNISVHSFAANFGAADPKTYLQRVFRFTHDALAQRPDLYVNYRIWDLNDPQSLSPENALLRAAIEQEFAFRVEDLGVDLRRKKGYLLRGRLYLNFDSRFEWPTLAQAIQSVEGRGFCHGLTSHFGVHADGTLVPCCLDKEAVLALGNCKDAPLAALLDGPRARRMRDGFAAGRLVEDLCQRCDFVTRFAAKAQRLARGGSARAAAPQDGLLLESR